MKLFAVLAVALILGGCSKKTPLRPDPAPEEWEQAVKAPEAAPDSVQSPGVQPKLASPSDGSVVGVEELTRNQNVVVFSWSQSAWNSTYTLELAADRNFTRVVLRKTVPRNMLAYRMTREGHFYWRVRTDSGAVSNVHQLTISR